MEPVYEDEPQVASAPAAQPKATAAHFGVALLLLHAGLTFVLWETKSFIAWDANTPISDAAFALMNILQPMVWPVIGCATAWLVFRIVADVIRSRAMPRLLPSDVATLLLLMAPAILAWAMARATPMNP